MVPRNHSGLTRKNCLATRLVAIINTKDNITWSIISIIIVIIQYRNSVSAYWALGILQLVVEGSLLS